MSSASYNITNDKLFVRFDERLSPDEYKLCKAAGFTWWPGSKQFVAKWSTQAEDYILAAGLTIEEEDAPDNVEARVERFAGYASEAEQSAASSETYLAERANTERRRKNAVNSIEKNLSAAEHWQSRIERAIRAAQYKERPDVIARRIDGLEKLERKFKKELAQKEWSIPSHCYVDGAYNAWRNRKAELEAKLNADRLADNPWSAEQKAAAIEELRPLKAAIFDTAKVDAAWKHHCDWAQRWLDHVQKRLQYERAALEAAGGIVAGVGAAPLDREKFQVGGAVKTGRDGWRIITKVNKRTVEVFDPHTSWRNYFKVDRTEITASASLAEVQNCELHSEIWHAKNAYDNKQREIREIMRVEKDHLPELEALSQAKGWGKYAHQGRDSQRQIVGMLLREQKGAAA